MEFDLTAAAFIRAGSGLLYVLLGVFLLLRGRSPRPGALALGAYCVLFGIGFVVTNAFASGTPEYEVVVSIVAWKDPFLGVAALVLAALFPKRVGRDERWTLWTGLFVAAVWAIAEGLYGLWNLEAFRVGYNYGVGEATIVALLTTAAANGGTLGLLAILALRYPRLAKTDPDWARRAAWLTAAVSIFIAFSAGSDALNGPDANYFPFGPGALVALLVLAFLWLLHMRVPPPRVARNVAWLMLAMLLSGLAAVILMGGAVPFLQTGAVGIARSVGWSVLVYAIVRERLVEVDVTLAAHRRGSIAAASLASLFIVAQVMQNFLAEEWGLIAGGIVAGALLFVAAPIQRTAERVLGGHPTTSPSRASEGVEAFRSAVRLALRGGPLRRDEEASLARLAAHLGLGYPEALDVIVSEEQAKKGRR